MSKGAEKVMVIHDASRSDGLSAIISAFESLPVGSGDELILLGVIHQLTSPLKIKSMSGSNATNKDDELVKKDEYRKREEVMQLSTICARNKIMFQIDVQSGSSPKQAAANTAKSLSVTWIVLDRQMKKYRKYFMEKLTCGILRMKQDNTVKKLRGPIIMEDNKLQLSKMTPSNDHVSYGQMVPLMSKLELSLNKTPNVQQPTFKPERGESSVESPWDTLQISSSPPSSNQISPSASKASTSSFGAYEVSTMNSNWTYDKKEQGFVYSICSVCLNKRPSIQIKKDFIYAELYQATNGFSSKNFLSEGGFGSVYIGELNIHGGLKVAVKQHKDASFQGEKEFKSEVNVLSMARHPNLVMLLGSCSEGTHRLLVYEFVCNGSLDQHFSKHAENPNLLTWDKRIRIALGAARGLEYLHRINIVHRDMRPNNILVTHDYESLLGDFGLARTDCGDTDETGVVGTLGYVAPEYAEYGKVSTKTDVYSFGVVLLQLITGCKTKEEKFDGKTLVEWARPLVEDHNYPDLFDEMIVDSPDVQIFQLYLMVRLAEGCLKKNPSKRFSMEHVVKQLECIMEGLKCWKVPNLYVDD